MRCARFTNCFIRLCNQSTSDGSKSPAPELFHFGKCWKSEIAAGPIAEGERCLSLAGDLAQNAQHAVGGVTLAAPYERIQRFTITNRHLILEQGCTFVYTRGHIVN